MALTPVQAFAAEKQYFYLSNTSQTSISLGIHDSDEDYKVTVANKKIATIQKKPYNEYGRKAYIYYLVPKKPGKTMTTLKNSYGTFKGYCYFLKYTNPISSMKLGNTTIKGSKFDKKDCITLSYKKYANKNLKLKAVPKKGCNLRIEMWDTKRNTKENVDIIFK